MLGLILRLLGYLTRAKAVAGSRCAARRRCILGLSLWFLVLGDI